MENTRPSLANTRKIVPSSLNAFDKAAMTSPQEFIDNKIVPKLLSVDQLASMLGVPKKTIYGWIYRGLIESVRIGPRLIRFDSEYIARWILIKK